MRYRIYFEALAPIEVDAYDVRVAGSRRVSLEAYACTSDMMDSCHAHRIDLFFPSEIQRIADDHDREIYRK